MKFRFIISMLLVAVFLYAGVAKMRSLEGFSQAIASLPWVPRWAVNPVAFGLPVFEILSAGALLSGAPTLWRAGALGLGLLLLAFILVWVEALSSGREFSCSCFGASSVLNFGGPLGAITRNIALLAAVIWFYLGCAARRHRT